MQLWTVIDGKMYKETNPHIHPDEREDEMEAMGWLEQLYPLVQMPEFPKKLQFWGRTRCDILVPENIANRRFDLEFPQHFWDNQPNLTNVIVHPEPYVFAKKGHDSYERIKTVQALELPWEHKISKAFFRGALTGQPYTLDGKTRVGRNKLMWDSLKYPEHIDFQMALINDFAYLKVPEEKEKTKKHWPLEFEINKYKYAIHIDGHASSWGRGAMILFSQAVPIVIESKFTPMYTGSWVPYVHYIPVKNDQSDLIEKIDWLKNNDEEARKIGANGKSLYKKLYSFKNLREDALTVFQKYASLMKYEPETPDSRFLVDTIPKQYQEGSDRNFEIDHDFTMLNYKKSGGDDGDFDEEDEEEDDGEKEEL